MPKLEKRDIRLIDLLFFVMLVLQVPSFTYKTPFEVYTLALKWLLMFWSVTCVMWHHGEDFYLTLRQKRHKTKREAALTAGNFTLST